MPDIAVLTASKGPELKIDVADDKCARLGQALDSPDEPPSAHPSGAATPWSRDDRNPLELSKLEKKLSGTNAQLVDSLAAQPVSL